eukprot:4141297-Amphidinium_carterae.1
MLLLAGLAEFGISKAGVAPQDLRKPEQVTNTIAEKLALHTNPSRAIASKFQSIAVSAMQSQSLRNALDSCDRGADDKHNFSAEPHRGVECCSRFTQKSKTQTR